MSEPEAGAPRSVRLAPDPVSARAARRHVAEVLDAAPQGGLDQVADTATLLVSEVVTNAVLHATTDIELSCDVLSGSLYVGVRDRSPVLPSRRRYDEGATTGRGLGLVEVLAEDWGVDVDDLGKTVWFRLSVPSARGTGYREPAGAPSPPPADSADTAGHAAPSTPATFSVRFERLPVALVAAALEYGDAVLRELALASMAADDDHPRAAWLAPQIDIGPVLDAVAQASAAGRNAIDVDLEFPTSCRDAALRRLALVDEADRMARDGELLTPPAVPEISACRRWLMSRIGLDGHDAPPVAWELPPPLEPVVAEARLSEAEVRRLGALTVGALVADDGNRIVYANAAAADLLGWDAGELEGRRLVTIVPPELRELHLAAFTRYLLTGHGRLIGRPVHVPALRRDGTTTDVQLTIESVELGGGRRGFRALLSQGPGTGVA